jgi:hypothetical protein
MKMMNKESKGLYYVTSQLMSSRSAFTWKGTVLDWNEQTGYWAGRPGCRSATDC